MDPRTRLILLATGLVFATVALVPRVAAARLPGNHRGYSPAQPIAYSHRLHAGELAIPCLYCHFGAERGRHAGIPPAQVCMNCHKFVTAPFADVRAEEKRAQEEGRKPEPVVSPELRKLLDAVDSGTPIAWTRVHKLPDFAFFDHRVHVAAGVTCQRCHGPVETMERMRQENDLTMGWCLDCHRDTKLTRPDGQPVEGSLDCGACHY